MNLLVMSDSHGSNRIIEEVLDRHQYDYALHLGDSESENFYNLIMVRGNSYNDKALPLEIIRDLKNKKVMLVHGHLYDVYYGLDRLYYKAKQEQVDYCFYGHTHIAYHEKIDGITFVNPGSLTRPRKGVASYMVIDTDTEECILYNLNGEEIKKYD